MTSRRHGKAVSKLEIGCGQRPTPGYLHQDITPQSGVELDFTCAPWEIPLPPGSLSEVVACGMMEHLTYSQFHQTVRHVCELLESGGAFIFDVPDMKVWSEYLYNLTHGRQHENPFTPEHVWSTIYGWQRWPGDEHKSGWTRDDVVKLLKETGFTRFRHGVDVFLSRGFERRRFRRPEDACVCIEAMK